MTHKKNFSSKLGALAVGAPLLTMGFVGLGAAPANAWVESPTNEYGDSVLVDVVEDTNVYSEPSASSNVIFDITADERAGFELVSYSESSGWAEVLLSNGETGYISISALSGVPADGGNGENGEGNGSNGNGESGNGDEDGNGDDDWTTDDEGNGDEITVDEGDDVVIDEGDEFDVDGDVVIEDEDSDPEDGFVERDVEEGDPVEIESGFIGGDNTSSAAGIAGLLGGGLLLAGGAYALMRRQGETASAENN